MVQKNADFVKEKNAGKYQMSARKSVDIKFGSYLRKQLRTLSQKNVYILEKYALKGSTKGASNDTPIVHQINKIANGVSIVNTEIPHT